MSSLSCDNGKEYISAGSTKYCWDNGTQIHFTVPYILCTGTTGVAESFNKEWSIAIREKNCNGMRCYNRSFVIKQLISQRMIG